MAVHVHLSHSVTYGGQCGSKTASVSIKHENKSLSRPREDLEIRNESHLSRETRRHWRLDSR